MDRNRKFADVFLTKFKKMKIEISSINEFIDFISIHTKVIYVVINANTFRVLNLTKFAQTPIYFFKDINLAKKKIVEILKADK